MVHLVHKVLLCGALTGLVAAGCQPSAGRRPGRPEVQRDAEAPPPDEETPPAPSRRDAGGSTPAPSAGPDAASDPMPPVIRLDAAPPPDASAPPAADASPAADPCKLPATFDFEADLHGAFAQGDTIGDITLTRMTSGAGCGNGSLRIKLKFNGTDKNKVVVSIPLASLDVPTLNKRLYCMVNRTQGSDTTTKIWVEAMTDMGNWLASWEAKPGAWTMPPERTLTKDLVTSSLTLWIAPGGRMASSWEGEVMIDHCAFR
jgi:hypothetical protein